MEKSKYSRHGALHGGEPLEKWKPSEIAFFGEVITQVVASDWLGFQGRSLHAKSAIAMNRRYIPVRKDSLAGADESERKSIGGKA